MKSALDQIDESLDIAAYMQAVGEGMAIPASRGVVQCNLLLCGRCLNEAETGREPLVTALRGALLAKARQHAPEAGPVWEPGE